MKKVITSFFRNIFGAKGSKAPAQQENASVVLTYSSQPHVLRQRMQEEQLTHGETVMANLSPVRVEKSHKNEAVLYFCPMKKIDVLQVTATGDGGSLPSAATLEGLSIPQPCASGFYTLRNVVLTSNGSMQVKATAETTWEKVEENVL